MHADPPPSVSSELPVGSERSGWFRRYQYSPHKQLRRAEQSCLTMHRRRLLVATAHLQPAAERSLEIQAPARGPNSSGVLLPKPLLLVVDDVGWRSGADRSADGIGAWRAGVERQHTDEDYLALAALGRRLKMRAQCGMILCDWDRERACAAQPTTTWLGAKYTNEELGDGKWAESAAALMLDEHAAHLEFTLHGVGHERWDWSGGAQRSRSEWFGAAHRNPQWKDDSAGSGGRHWPLKDLQGHVTCFTAIMQQYKIEGFPETFVPTGFCYSWHTDSSRSTGHFMRTQGVKLCTNPFDVTTFSGGERATRPAIDGGLDHGLLVLDRGRYADRIPYDAVATVPGHPPPLNCSVCGIHFVNMLAEDKQDNLAVVERYADYFEQAGAVHGRVLSRNSLELASQWLHHAYTSVTIAEADRGVARRPVLTVSIDSSRLPREALPLVGPVIFQLVNTTVGPGDVDVDGSKHRRSMRRLTEIRIPLGSTLRPVAVWEHCGHAFVSVMSIQGSLRNAESAGSETLELSFEEGRRGGPGNPWHPTARLVAGREDNSILTAVLPLVLRSDDTCFIENIAMHQSVDAEQGLLKSVLIDCVVYGSQQIDVLLPIKPRNICEVARSGESAHITLALRAVAPGAVEGTHIATVQLQVVGRWVNGKKCRIRLA